MKWKQPRQRFELETPSPFDIYTYIYIYNVRLLQFFENKIGLVNRLF